MDLAVVIEGCILYKPVFITSLVWAFVVAISGMGGVLASCLSPPLSPEYGVAAVGRLGVVAVGTLGVGAATRPVSYSTSFSSPMPYRGPFLYVPRLVVVMVVRWALPFSGLLLDVIAYIAAICVCSAASACSY